MRVLAVGNMYPPHHFGGYELVWRSAMTNLERHGHSVRVLTSDFTTDSSEADDPNVARELRWYWRNHAFPALSRLERARLERHNARVLRRDLREFRPDVVSWWSMGGMSLSLIERVRRQGLPAVAFVHDDWLDYGREVDGWTRVFANRSPLLGTMAELFTGAPTRVDLNSAARCLFVSERTRMHAIASGVVPRSAGIAHSGIESGLLDPAPGKEWSWSLLYVGRLDPRKGADTAVEALTHLPDAAGLTLVGGWDDAEEERLRALAARQQVASQVQFRGQCSRAEVRAAYDDADVVVFPVRWEEPWGLVPLEAMARGRLVVATGRGGSADYLRDGMNSLLFQADDARSLAAAVSRLAEGASLRNRLREAGFETAARHTEEGFNATVLNELERAAAAK